ncbi:MAG: hypothetical protein JWO56_1455 [Acidobacteria bacterium]|nr:hypothetical protein [Acidobacteriota bacterium]
MASKSGGSSSKRPGGGSSSRSGGRSSTSSKSGGDLGGGGIASVADSVASEVSSFSLSDTLQKLGISEEKLGKLKDAFEGIDVSESVDKATEYLSQQVEKARDYTRKNPKTVAGGAAGVLVGASLLAYALTRSGGSSKKSSGSRSGGSKSSSGSSSKKASSSSSKKGGSSSKKSGGSSSKKSGGSSLKKK